MKFKILSPGNHESPFALSFKTIFMNHDNPYINEEVLGLQSSLLCNQGWNISKSTNTLRPLSPENRESPFALSIKAFFMTIYA